MYKLIKTELNTFCKETKLNQAYKRNRIILS